MYKKVASGRRELWNEHIIYEAVNEKFGIWNEVVEKVNADFEGSRKEFWAFVGGKQKGSTRALLH